jgi:cysteine desulfurase / selenocysteine lyase
LDNSPPPFDLSLHASFADDSQLDSQWEVLRRLMPSAGNWTYFDHAAVAPLSAPARAALAAWADDLAINGAANWPTWAAQLEHVRRRGAELLHADPTEIALVSNTTAGINLVAEGLPWRAGDNVVAPADEFPSNLYPWMNLASRGVELRRVQTDGNPLAELCAACDARTRLVTVSWVGYASGWRHDVDALAEAVHERGALLFLDAIQGLGLFPLDVRQTPVDFLAADGHKWLLGPEGAGLFFTRREHLDLLRPIGLGWNSVVQAHEFSHVELNLKPAASRYEGGSYNMPGLLALGASLELLAPYSLAQRAERVLELTALVCERLAKLGASIVGCREPEHASGIVSFELPGRPSPELRRRCRERHVIVSCREGRVRVSPHVYNTEDDVERLIEALS